MKLGLLTAVAVGGCVMGTSMVSALPLNLPGGLLPDISAKHTVMYNSGTGMLTATGNPISLELGLFPGADYDFDLVVPGTFSLSADLNNNTGSLSIAGLVLDYPSSGTDTPLSLTSANLLDWGFTSTSLEFVFSVDTDSLGIFGSQVGVIMNLQEATFNLEQSLGLTNQVIGLSDAFKLPEPPTTIIPEPLSAGLGMMGLLALAGAASSRRRA